MPSATTDYTTAALFALALLGLVALGLRKRNALPLERNLLLAALAIKLLAGCAYGYYQLHQTGYLSDAVAYYRGAHGLWDYVLAKPGEGLQLLTMPYDFGIMTTWLPCVPFSDDPRPYNLVRALALLVPLTGGGYYTLNVILSAVGFWGAWLCYATARSVLPAISPVAFLIFMVEPLTVFFTSGLSKEPVMMACLGLLLWGMQDVSQNSRFRWQTVLALLAAGWVGYSVKPFPILAFCICAPVWVVCVQGWQLVQRWPARLAFLALVSVGVYLMFFSAFRLEVVFAEIFYLRGRAGEYLSPEALKASSYFAFADYEPTVGWALGKIPHAIFATFFRPLPQEAHSAFAIAVSVFNVLFLGVVIYLVLRTRWRALLALPGKAIAMPVFLLCYTLPYAYFLGISTTFFGSLIRYRVATLPFFLLALFMLYFLSRHTHGVTDNQSVAET